MKIEAIESMGLFSSHILTMSKAKTQVDLSQANLFPTSMSGVCAAIDWLMSKAQHDGYADVSEETRNNIWTMSEQFPGMSEYYRNVGPACGVVKVDPQAYIHVYVRNLSEKIRDPTGSRFGP